MASIIPEQDGRLALVVLITKLAQTTRTQHEGSCLKCFKTQPIHSQHPQEMGTGKQQHVTPHFADALHDSSNPLRNFPGRLAVRTAVTEKQPTWTLGKDVCRPAALIRAIVPFDKIGIDGGGGAKAGQLARPDRTAQWARIYRLERYPTQALA